MYKFLKEIKELLETNLVSQKTAETSTTSTTIKITNHGLSNGDLVINQTRANAKRAVAVVDNDTFTVEAISSQVSGDTILIPKFKYFFVGKVANPPINYLPVVMVYGNSTNLETKATNKDSYIFNVTIEILTNSFNQINATSGNELTGELLAQKEIWEKMEERDANGIPLENTILGIMRRNIAGNNFLYNNEIEINYETETVNDTLCYRGIMNLSLVTNLNLRK